ncbi:MAG: PAS domain S-box protein [bacterium]|nr:PAS domain S-box protein [bacterium]
MGTQSSGSNEERKRVEAELEESRRSLSTLMGNLPGMAYRCRKDENWTMEFVSEGCLNLTGYQPSELIGNQKSSFERLIYADDQKRVRETVDIALQNKRSFQMTYRITTADGEEKWVWEQGCGVFSQEGDFLGLEGFITDITERRETEARMRAILDTTVDGMITIDEQGIVESFNPAAEEIFGYRPEEVIGQNVRLLMPEPYHSEHDGYIANYSRTGQAKIIGLGREVTGRRKDGTTFPLDLAVSEFHLGEHRRFAGIVRDITDRKRLEEQLIQSSKLAALGELVGGIAHEVNNPTGIIVMRIASLMEDARALGLPEDLIDDIEVIQRQSDKIAQITSGLLAFSRQTPFSDQLSDINRTVQNAVGLVENVLRSKGVVYHSELAEDLPLVHLDTTRIEQVLLNLFNNAMDAMPEGGELHVETALEQDEKHWVVVSVKDTGEGIREEDVGRLFDPFFTTKEVGKGTGLGLSISYGIVEEHGGRIEVQSKWGDGAEFQIYLPVDGKDQV